jgi:hypothetical protein
MLVQVEVHETGQLTFLLEIGSPRALKARRLGLDHAQVN